MSQFDVNDIIRFVSSDFGVAMLINMAFLLEATKPVKRGRKRNPRQANPPAVKNRD